MKIAIPLSENIITVSDLLAPSFHHTSLLGIYDLETGSLEKINLQKDDCSVDFTELLKEYEVKAVIGAIYTVMVLKLFKVLSIATFRASEGDLTANIEAFRDGLLPRYTYVDAMEASKLNCESSCDSCQSIC